MEVPTREEILNRKEVVFMQYDGVLKHSLQKILYLLGNDLHDEYSRILDIEILKGIDMQEALIYASSMTNINPFISFAKDSILEEMVTYGDIHYVKFIEKYRDHIYRDLDNLAMMSRLGLMKQQKFMDKVYIYHPFPEYLIEESIELTFSSLGGVHYVYGPIDDVLKGIETPITSFFISDIELVPNIAKYDKLNFVDVNIARHRYNYTYSEDYLNGDDTVYPYVLKHNPKEFFSDKYVEFTEFDAIGYFS